MRLARAVSFVACVVLACGAPALAQQVGPPSDHGIYVAALTGASFGPQTAATFAAEYGERIHRNVQAYATLSYHENLMDRSLQDELALLSSMLTARTGTPWRLQGRDRGVAFAVGAKVMASGAAARPYVGAGVGAINVRRSITEPLAGDVTQAVLTQFGLGEVLLTSESLTRPMAEASAGVAFYAGRAYVDVGYRFRRAFRMSERLDFSQLALGVGVTF